MVLEGAFFFLLIGFYDYFGLGFTTLLILKVAFVRVSHYHLKKKQRAQVLRCVPLSDHRLLGLNFSQKIKLGSYAFLNFSFSFIFLFFFFFKGRDHLSTTRQRHLSTFDNETAIDRNIFAILTLLSTFVDANLSLFSLN